MRRLSRIADHMVMTLYFSRAAWSAVRFASTVACCAVHSRAASRSRSRSSACAPEYDDHGGRIGTHPPRCTTPVARNGRPPPRSGGKHWRQCATALTVR